MKEFSEEAILDFLPVKYFIIDVESHQIVKSNHPILREELRCNVDFCQLNHPDSSFGKFCFCDYALKDYKTSSIKNIQNVNGELFTSSFKIVPINHDGYKLSHVLVQVSELEQIGLGHPNSNKENIPTTDAVEIISLHSIDGNILFANEKAQQLLFKERDEFETHNISNYLQSPQISDVQLLFASLIEENRSLKQGWILKNEENQLNYQVKLEPVLFGEYLKPSILIYWEKINPDYISENKLKQSESNFKMIADNISDVIWKMDLATLKYTYVSPSIQALRGLTQEEAMSESLEQSLYPEDYVKVQEILANALVDYKMGNRALLEEKFEFRQYHKDKSLVWIEITVSIIEDGMGNPKEILGVSRNITLKHQKKEELLQSLERERFFADIIRNSSQAIGIGYPDGRGVLLNQSAYDLLGYSEEQMTTLNWTHDLTPPEWRDQEMEMLTQAISGKKSVTYEKEYFHFDGHRIPIRLLVHPKFDEEENLQYFIAFITDITEIKKTRQQLIESKERLEYAIKGSNDGLWDWDVKSGYMYMSPRYAEMLGYGPNELEPNIQTYYDLLHPNDYQRIMAIHELQLAEKDIKADLQFRLKHKNGHWVSILSRPFQVKDEKGNAIRFVGTHIDLTEIQKIQQNLKESEEKYKILFDNTNVGIGITTTSGLLLSANNQLLEFLGLTADNFQHTDISNHYKHVVDRAYFLEMLGKNGQVSNFNIQLCDKYGRDRWVSLSSKVINIKGEEQIVNIVSDIDQKMNAERQLRESEERFKQLSQLTIEGILIHENGKTIDINESLLNLLEYKREDVLGLNIIDLCSTERSRPIFYLHVKNNSVEPYEAEVLTKSGKTIPVEVISRPAMFNGKRVRVTSILDISKRIETESLLKKLSTAVEQTANSIVITDIDGNIEYVNPEFEKTTSYSFEEVKGKKASILNSRKLPAKLFTNLWETISSGKAWSGEFLNIDKLGNYFWEQATITPIKDKLNQITNYLAVKENITQKKKDTEKLENLNKRLSLAVRVANFGVWEFDQQTKEIYWDDRMHEIFELEHDDDINKVAYFRRLISQKHWIHVVKQVAKSFETENVFEYEFPILLDNTQKHLKTYILVSQSQDVKYRKLIGITYDNTQQKLFEKEIISERKKAQESDHLKSAFLANMSHEIRTPLNGIIGFTEILQDIDFDISEAEKKQYLEIISNNSQVLLHLVNDIIDLSKIETGQLQINLQVHHLKDLLAKVIDNFKNQIENKGLKFICDQLDEDIVFKTDYTRLTQILTNLISNALKFTDEGYIKIGFEDNDDFIQFYLEDTGCGVSSEAQNIIFDRFAQGKPVRDQLLGGTGLGLSITKGLVHLLGGSIWIESKEDMGSTFYFTVQKNL